MNRLRRTNRALSKRANAARNGVAHARFAAGDVADLFRPLVRERGAGARGGDAHDAAFDPARTCVIIDPPRQGCDAGFLDQLFRFAPARVVYVSCDPSTQARDAAAFARARYTLREVLPFDLFPQTRHIESVAVFDAPPRSPGDAPLPLRGQSPVDAEGAQ